MLKRRVLRPRGAGMELEHLAELGEFGLTLKDRESCEM